MTSAEGRQAPPAATLPRLGSAPAGRVGRPRGPRRSRDERRVELLDAAERAIQRIGPDASMEELAAEAGITKPILYSHFGDKAGLANALASRVAAELDAAISTSLDQVRHPRHVVSSTIDAFCSFIETRNALYRFLIKAATSNPDKRTRSELIASFARRIADVLEVALQQVGADTRSAEPWSYAIVGMTLASGEWWLEYRTMSRHDMVDHLTRLLWSGLEGAGLDRLGDLVPAADPADA